MNVSLEYLQRCSAQTGYRVEPLEKVVRLGGMAADVARHPFLGSILALKGGTAFNLCFGPPKRLSVDLDYNYIGHLSRTAMLEARPAVEQAVVDLARRQGYRVQQSADAFAGRKYYLLYRSIVGPEERIEVDLNFLFRLPIAGIELRDLWQPGELDHPRVRVVSLEEILIGKFLALLGRGAGRDAWDIAYPPLSTSEILRSLRFRRWFIALSSILEHPLSTYTRERLDATMTDRDITERLSPMLAGPAPVRNELIERAWYSISGCLSLDPNEEAFIAAVQQGELKPEMLFPDNPEEAGRLLTHPAILWKIQNVKNYLARPAGQKRQHGSIKHRN
ncbi:MAG: nucleotidyl transferase AbiEii/AbiGii toxin family protein [Spirochaetota bacterium]